MMIASQECRLQSSFSLCEYAVQNELLTRTTVAMDAALSLPHYEGVGSKKKILCGTYVVFLSPVHTCAPN